MYSKYFFGFKVINITNSSHISPLLVLYHFRFTLRLKLMYNLDAYQQLQEVSRMQITIDASWTANMEHYVLFKNSKIVMVQENHMVDEKICTCFFQVLQLNI